MGCRNWNPQAIQRLFSEQETGRGFHRKYFRLLTVKRHGSESPGERLPAGGSEGAVAGRKRRGLRFGGRRAVSQSTLKFPRPVRAVSRVSTGGNSRRTTPR